MKTKIVLAFLIAVLSITGISSAKAEGVKALKAVKVNTITMPGQQNDRVYQQGRHRWHRMHRRRAHERMRRHHMRHVHRMEARHRRHY
ncbi:MAG: hypothetical protein JSS82_15055 [Bacteroidetes bacterium]|nr:hypothetical protein [Bacteroidota bacterium]